MLLLWRGWAGPVALLIMSGSLYVFGVIGSGFQHLGPFILGMGAIGAGVANWFLGIWVNKTQPGKAVSQFQADRHRELHTLAEQGRFSFGPGHPRPTSLMEAHQQADQLLALETKGLRAQLCNRHHLWFIPVQFWGVIAGALGVLICTWGIFHVFPG